MGESKATLEVVALFDATVVLATVGPGKIEKYQKVT